MTNIKETIEELKSIKGCINQSLIAQRGMSLFIPKNLEVLTHTIKILQAVESTEGELPEKYQDYDFNGMSYVESLTDYEQGSNEMHDIARSILAKAKLRIEELEKMTSTLADEVLKLGGKITGGG